MDAQRSHPRIDAAEALNLRVAQEYIAQFGNLAKTGNTVILPSNLADIAGIVASLTQVFGKNPAT